MGQKLGFLSYLQVWVISFSGNSLEHFLTTSKGKTHKRNFEGPKLGPKLEFLPFYQGCIISFP